MALLNCPDCGGKVSSEASRCPHCGCPSTRVLGATKSERPACGTIPASGVDQVPDLTSEIIVELDEASESAGSPNGSSPARSSTDRSAPSISISKRVGLWLVVSVAGGLAWFLVPGLKSETLETLGSSGPSETDTEAAIRSVFQRGDWNLCRQVPPTLPWIWNANWGGIWPHIPRFSVTHLQRGEPRENRYPMRAEMDVTCEGVATRGWDPESRYFQRQTMSTTGHVTLEFALCRDPFGALCPISSDSSQCPTSCPH